jgi:hypothetical protein
VEQPPRREEPSAVGVVPDVGGYQVDLLQEALDGGQVEVVAGQPRQRLLVVEQRVACLEKAQQLLPADHHRVRVVDPDNRAIVRNSYDDLPAVTVREAHEILGQLEVPPECPLEVHSRILPIENAHPELVRGRERRDPRGAKVDVDAAPRGANRDVKKGRHSAHCVVWEGATAFTALPTRS